MPEIEIRPAVAQDIPTLVAIDHNYTTEYVWQMEIQSEEGLVGVSFREIRLPRSVRVEYPHRVDTLTEDWNQRAGLLVALLEGQPVGYISLMLNIAPLTAWVSDLTVIRRLRLQGIGSTLVLAGQELGSNLGCQRIVLEMQPKNYATIHLAQKLGYDFCGYNERYYANYDIGLFFGKSIR
ncbi:MAG: GNAT family N-acetyltransferase [Anaerolineales bacterium]|jgi:ribosomal protein S18 acetylase RimI-like enzyme|nr:GNAT family N-acetyltransferase [Anaerolineales bacterium]MCK5428130.1 GNAT family N-acetyltransferase [Anaerolineales bacterium]